MNPRFRRCSAIRQLEATGYGRETSTNVCDRAFNRSAASRTFGEDGLWIAEAKLAKSRTICHAVKVPKVLEKDGFFSFSTATTMHRFTSMSAAEVERRCSIWTTVSSCGNRKG